MSGQALPLAARPFEYLWDPGRSALILIDIQKDFVEAGGFGESLGNDVSLLRAILEPTKKVLDEFRKLGLPVIHTLESHKPDLSDCPPAKRLRGNPSLRIGDPGPMGRILVQGEPGNGIVPEVEPIAGEKVIHKPGKGAFYETDLQEFLEKKGIQQLIFGGVTTEVCVQTTMREANDRGYDCLLLEDCTESYFPEFKKAAIDMITAQGAIVGWSAPSKLLLEAIRELPKGGPD